MPNTVTITATKANTSKAIEYSRDGGATWQSSNVFTNVPAGTIAGAQFVARLVGTAITDAWETAVTVSDPAPGSTPLAAPAGGTATATGPASLNVTANTVSGATGYRLYRSATSNGVYSQVGGTLGSPSYSDTGLTASTTYYYKWQALGNGTTTSDSPQSTAFSGTTQAAQSSYSQATLDHEARVLADGGSGVDKDLVEGAFALLSAWAVPLTAGVGNHWSEPGFGLKLDSNGRVLKGYCLFAADLEVAPGQTGPLYEPTGLNGNPRLRFQNNLLRVPTLNLGGTSAITLVTLFDFGTLPAAGYMLPIELSTDYNTNDAFVLAAEARLFWGAHGPGSNDYVTRNEASAYVAGQRLFVLSHDRSRTPSQQIKLRINEAEVAAHASDLNQAVSGNFTAAPLHVGARAGLVGPIADGHITPLMLLNRELTDAQKQAAEARLIDKYLTEPAAAASMGTFNASTFE